jgi:hypothetical protein
MLQSEDRARPLSRHGPKLVAMVGGDFAMREGSLVRGPHGKELLDQLERPIKVTSCRDGVCTDYYHNLPLRLPSRTGARWS